MVEAMAFPLTTRDGVVRVGVPDLLFSDLPGFLLLLLAPRMADPCCAAPSAAGGSGGN